MLKKYKVHPGFFFMLKFGKKHSKTKSILEDVEERCSRLDSDSPMEEIYERVFCGQCGTVLGECLYIPLEKSV